MLSCATAFRPRARLSAQSRPRPRRVGRTGRPVRPLQTSRFWRRLEDPADDARPSRRTLIARKGAFAYIIVYIISFYPCFDSNGGHTVRRGSGFFWSWSQRCPHDVAIRSSSCLRLSIASNSCMVLFRSRGIGFLSGVTLRRIGGIIVSSCFACAQLPYALEIPMICTLVGSLTFPHTSSKTTYIFACVYVRRIYTSIHYVCTIRFVCVYMHAFVI